MSSLPNVENYVPSQNCPGLYGLNSDSCSIYTRLGGVTSAEGTSKIVCWANTDAIFRKYQKKMQTKTNIFFIIKFIFPVFSKLYEKKIFSGLPVQAYLCNGGGS